MCLVAIAATAQNNADIEVRYENRSKYSNGAERIHVFHLLTNPRMSKFFDPQSEEIDSMSSTPEGMAKVKQMQEAALKAMIAQGSIEVKNLPTKKVYIYVLKSSADSCCTVYDKVGKDEYLYYSEPFSELQWEIGDSVRNILGYECLKAETDYHGRHWTAWFSPEIPIQDGPWKFRGLPGLILEVFTGHENGYFATGIVKSSKDITPIYGADRYTKSERKKILQSKRRIIDNPRGYLSANGIKVTLSNGNDNNDSYDFDETDYH